MSERTGIEPRRAEAASSSDEASAHPPEPSPPPGPSPPPPHLLEEHDCTALSAAYRSCMRHRRDRPLKCKTERHEYLVCMSGRWAVDPSKHEELAALYGREFAAGAPAA